MRKDPVSSNPAECPAFRTVKAYKIKIKSPTISNVHTYLYVNIKYVDAHSNKKIKKHTL